MRPTMRPGRTTVEQQLRLERAHVAPLAGLEPTAQGCAPLTGWWVDRPEGFTAVAPREGEPLSRGDLMFCLFYGQWGVDFYRPLVRSPQEV